jgi:two-component system chemotaxis sensor kinase CheA
MSTNEDEFLEMLRATFKVEAAEHLQTIEAGLLELEKAPALETQHNLVETVFRAAHSLKGAARAVDFLEIESRCQFLEDTFATWKRLESAPSESALDMLHSTLDGITAAMAVPAPSREPVPESGLSATPAPAMPAAGKAVTARASAAGRTLSPQETVRITVAKLDAQVWEAEEMLTAKLTAGQRADDLRELATRFAPWQKEWMALEPDVRALRQTIDGPAHGLAASPSPELARLLAFLDRDRDHLKSLEGQVAALSRTADQDRQVVGKLVDDLLDDSKKLLLLPFATLAAPFPKLVRDLCRDQGKEADLVVHGEDVEMDKRILEEMKDPLIHLLRNAIVHGIETPEERRRSGKSSRATITLAVSRVDGNKMELLVSDDGTGIDLAKVKKSAAKRGLLLPDDVRQIDDAEAGGLIFETGVSTSPMITRLSGRGLGLAIVREKTEKLGGTLAVHSQPRHGTQFSVVLPSMLATFRGILIEAAQRVFVVPTLHVERVARVRADEIQTVEGRDTVSLSGRAIALVQLADVLQLARASSTDERSGH